MASRLKLVIRRFASICTNSGLRNGARNPIKLLPSGSADACPLDTAWTIKRQSASAATCAASATTWAPAEENSASGIEAARPAPLSTDTECFFLSNCFIASGTRATLVSPGLSSLNTPNLINYFKIGGHTMRNRPIFKSIVARFEMEIPSQFAFFKTIPGLPSAYSLMPCLW